MNKPNIRIQDQLVNLMKDAREGGGKFVNPTNTWPTETTILPTPLTKSASQPTNSPGLNPSELSSKKFNIQMIQGNSGKNGN
jgi:hypothetical protein